ncbi:MAG: MBL fold metallo-hydrolase [Chloroflexota bacterium]|nr:MBL fold metallo-hydrolase [Chloroflexota bacterium]
MFLKQFYIEGLAHASYMVGAEGVAAVIDPRRDVDIYLREAKEQGLAITHIFETHLHADFVSGHLELARQTGAKILMPKSAGVQYDYVPLSEGIKLRIGSVEFGVLETPGHTPEHIGLVVADLSRAEEPCLVFTGDVLFVGDVGRPDLFGAQMAKELSEKLFVSLHDKLGNLSDFVEVYPAHGEGSLCGKNLSAKRCSTIGYEKRFNHAFKPASASDFSNELLVEMPLVPRYFHRTSEVNRKGPRILGQLPQLNPLSLEESKKIYESGNTVLDIRTPESFGGAHIPSSYNIWFSPALSTWAGSVLPYNKPIILILDDADHREEVVRQLIRVGFDDLVGYIDGGMETWMNAGLPISRIPQLSVHELKEKLSRQNEILVTDVRSGTEYNSGHIAGALNIHAGQIDDRHVELDNKEPVAVVCRTAHRSSIAGSILKKHGFSEVYNISGGMTAWANAGYEVVS